MTLCAKPMRLSYDSPHRIFTQTSLRARLHGPRAVRAGWGPFMDDRTPLLTVSRPLSNSQEEEFMRGPGGRGDEDEDDEDEDEMFSSAYQADHGASSAPAGSRSWRFACLPDSSPSAHRCQCPVSHCFVRSCISCRVPQAQGEEGEGGGRVGGGGRVCCGRSQRGEAGENESAPQVSGPMPWAGFLARVNHHGCVPGFELGGLAFGHRLCMTAGALFAKEKQHINCCYRFSFAGGVGGARLGSWRSAQRRRVSGKAGWRRSSSRQEGEISRRWRGRSCQEARHKISR